MRENAGSWIVKILFAIIIVVFVFAFGMSGLDTSNDPVLATVNDQIITRAEFEESFQRAADSVRQANPGVTSDQLQSPEFKQMVLGELVNTRLLLAEADRLGISASPEEVFAGITRQSVFWNPSGQFDPNIYQAALRSIRMTPAQFEANFKSELIANKVRDMIVKTGEVTPAQVRAVFDWAGEQIKIDYIATNPASFMDSVEVTEEEVQDFYTKNAERFMVPALVSVRYISFTPADLATFQTVADEEIKQYYDANITAMRQEEEVKARHILVLTKDADPESVQAEAKNKIDRVYKKAKAGEDFGELAKTYSEGPSKVTGGELGWFGRGAMVPEFETAAFATPKGSVSEPFKTQFGWHIVLVEDKKEAATKPLEEVKEAISRAIAEEKASEKVTDLLDQSMDRLASGMTLDAVADEVGLLAVTSENIPEQFLPQAFGLTPEAAKVVMAIPEGKAHETPLAINGGYMLIEKVKDTMPAPMDIEQVKTTIIDAIKQEKALAKAQEAAEQLLEKLTKTPEAISEYADQVQTSEPFYRQGDIPGLGQNPNLATAAFTDKTGSWLPQPFNMPMGIIIAKVNERLPASEEDWAANKGMMTQQANVNYEQEVFNAFMAKLRDEATIEIARPDLLN